MHDTTSTLTARAHAVLVFDVAPVIYIDIDIARTSSDHDPKHVCHCKRLAIVRMRQRKLMATKLMATESAARGAAIVALVTGKRFFARVRA